MRLVRTGKAAAVVFSAIMLAAALVGCGSQAPSPASGGKSADVSSNSAVQVGQSGQSEEAGSDADNLSREFASDGDPVKSFDANVGSRNGYRVFHVRTADFQFDLPAYWRGKVEWFDSRLPNGYTEVSICPIGMSDRTSSGDYEYALVTVTATDADAPVAGGDIGGGLVAHVDGSDKDVVAYQKNWTFLGREHGPDARTGSRKYTLSELDKLIGLATGGKLEYADCKNSSNDTACMSYNSAQFEGRIKVGAYSDPATPAKTANEYFMPDTDLVTYNVRIWNGMDNHELFIARNEIFARYGCGFKSQELRDYFGKQAWYKETIDAGTYDTSLLNTVERENANAMLAIEKDRNSPYI